MVMNQFFLHKHFLNTFTTRCARTSGKHLTCLLFTLILHTGLTNSSYSATSLDKGEEQVRINIGKLEKSIISHQEAIKTEHDNELTLLDELEVLEDRLIKTQDKLDELEFKVIAQKLQIEGKMKILDIAIAEKISVQKHLQQRMHAYYTMGHVGFLNVTFSTKTLHELLSFRESFDSLVEYDKKLIAVYRTTIEALQRNKQALDLEKGVLEDFIAKVNTEKEAMNDTKREKENILVRIRTQQRLHAQAIKEMQDSGTELTEDLKTIKKKQEIQNNIFLKNKGHLLPPVDGEIITRFQEEKPNALGDVRKSMGIALKVADGTPIIAIENGEIVFSGYLRGYGNTVIIHHDFQYYTVTSRIEKISKKTGVKVKAGDIIGITGDTATLIEDGLYFEIRHGKQSLDPMLWLEPTLLQASHN